MRKWLRARGELPANRHVDSWVYCRPWCRTNIGLVSVMSNVLLRSSLLPNQLYKLPDFRRSKWCNLARPHSPPARWWSLTIGRVHSTMDYRDFALARHKQSSSSRNQPSAVPINTDGVTSTHAAIISIGKRFRSSFVSRTTSTIIPTATPIRTRGAMNQEPRAEYLTSAVVTGSSITRESRTNSPSCTPGVLRQIVTNTAPLTNAVNLIVNVLSIRTALHPASTCPFI